MATVAKQLNRQTKKAPSLMTQSHGLVKLGELLRGIIPLIDTPVNFEILKRIYKNS